MLYQNSGRVQGDVRWKQWLIPSRSALSMSVSVPRYVGVARVRYTCVSAAHRISLHSYEAPLLPAEFADASWRNATLLLRRNVSVQSSVSMRVWERDQERMKENLIIYRFIITHSLNCPSFQLPVRLKRDVVKDVKLSLECVVRETHFFHL